jgi:diaminopimelate epimerase
MGNPHAVCFVDDCDAVPLEIVGPFVEHNDRFPNRTNVEFVTIESPTRIRQRTWERGSGETLACGTGAAATAVAAMLTERIPGPQVTIALRGGDLTVTWDGQLDSPVFQHGAATTVFAGSWPLT